LVIQLKIQSNDTILVFGVGGLPLDDVEVVAVVALPDDEVAGRDLPLEHGVQDFAQLKRT
jgi:hypothetical protein